MTKRNSSVLLALYSLTLGCLQSKGQVTAQQRFITPIEGEYKKDFIVLRYVDWGPGDSVRDSQCGSKTYNQHTGTDFVIRDFKAMDSGVFVLAADSGTVIMVKDGEYDREVIPVLAKGLANMIAIKHDRGVITYYGHLKNGSMLVKFGDHVQQGQRIGQVGSSGNSSEPHLHFEISYVRTYTVDPFSGNCSKPDTWWLQELPYDSTFWIWKSGLCNSIIDYNGVKQGPQSQDTFYRKDRVVTYWAILNGMRQNDSWRVTWIAPAGTVWHTATGKARSPYWLYYLSPYLEVNGFSTKGKWQVRLYVNDKLVDSKSYFLK